MQLKWFRQTKHVFGKYLFDIILLNFKDNKMLHE